MTTSSALLHPVRLRIVQVLLGNGPLTTRQLHEHLPDVPIATLYRHVGHLATHDVLDVADEQQIRGASERSYRLASGFANPTPAELDALAPDELLTAFTVFASGIIRDFEQYLRGDRVDLVADQVSLAQADFWATNAEVETFLHTVMDALTTLRAQGPAAGRRRRTLTTVLLPAPHSGSEDAA